MDNINLEYNHNNNQHTIISTSTEFNLKENFNNLIELNSSSMHPTVSIVTNLNEKTFDTILKNIKEENPEENYPLVSDDLSDIEDLAVPKDKSINRNMNIIKKKKKPLYKSYNNIKDLSNKKDINNYESNLQKLGHSNSIIENQTRSMIINSSHLSNNQNKGKTLSKVCLFKSHNCSTCCVWCKASFAVFDNPNHIGRIRNIEKQNSFLKIESTLKLDSCLCDRCWKYLEKTFKNQVKEKRIGNNIALNLNEVTGSSDNVIENTNNSVIPNINYKHKNMRCSVHKCMENGIHLIFKDDYVIIYKIFSKFNISSLILIEKKNETPTELNVPSLLLCEEHLLLVNVITTCQICCNRLNYNLSSDVWERYFKWNRFLESIEIPLTLVPGMFLCVGCESCIIKRDFSTYDIEFIRYNVEKRKDACLKAFAKNLVNNFEGVNVYPIVDAKMFEFDNSAKAKKVKFTDPLITSIHYYMICNTNSKKIQKMLNMFSNQEKVYNEITDPFGLEIISNADKILLDPVEVNVNDDDYSYKPNKEFTNASVDLTFDSESQNIETSKLKENVNSSSSCVNKYQKPNIRVMKMMQLLKKKDTKHGDKLSEHNNQEYMPTNLAENSTNCDTFNNTVDIDVDKNLLPLHVCNLLDNDENRVFINENVPRITNLFSFNDVNNDENKMTNHVVKKENVKTDQYTLSNNNMYPQKSIFNINQDINIHKDNQNTSDEDVSIVYLNELDLNSNSPILVDTPKAETDPVEIRKKLRNVVCQRIEKEGSIKKRRLTNTSEINRITTYADNNENNYSCNNDTVETFGNHNFNSIDIEELSSGEDEVINESPSINVESTYNLDSDCSQPLKFDRTLQKVPDFYNKKTSNNNIINSPINQNHHNISYDKILTDDSYEHETNSNIYKYQSKMNRKKFLPIPKCNTRSKVKSPKLSDLTNDKNICKTVYISDSDDEKEPFDLELNEANIKLYNTLMAEFNGDDDKILLHLINNQKLLCEGKLVLSSNSSKYTNNYIRNNFVHLHSWYDDPQHTDANQSYLLNEMDISNDSDQFSPNREMPVIINDINSTLSPSSSHSNIPISTAISHIIPHVKDDVIADMTPEIIEVIDDISSSFSPRSDHLDDTTSTTMTCYMPHNEVTKDKVDNITTTTTLDTDDIIYTSSQSSVYLDNHLVNQGTRFQDHNTKQTLTTDKPKCNFQLPVAIRSPSVNLPTFVQPSFQLPTAVRSKGMSFVPKNGNDILRPNCITNIRHPFNYNNNGVMNKP